jgi:hypothetical protein
VIYQHGNTTGGPIEAEEFGAAVELLLATGDKRYATRVEQLTPTMLRGFGYNAQTVLKALPQMPRSYRAKVEPAARKWAREAAAMTKANPFAVPITDGGWAGSGSVLGFGLTGYALHRAFPQIVGTEPVYRALDFIHGHHPSSNKSFVSGVGAMSNEVAYGNNRADFTFIPGGVVPGVLLLKPDYPENRDDWPFFWGENEYVVPEGAMYIALALSGNQLEKDAGSR